MTQRDRGNAGENPLENQTVLFFWDYSSLTDAEFSEISARFTPQFSEAPVLEKMTDPKRRREWMASRFLEQHVRKIMEWPATSSRSHSGGYTVCSFSNGALLGVDVERGENATQALKVIPRIIRPEELKDLDSVSENEKEKMALKLWSLKEAYGKLKKTGITSLKEDEDLVFEIRDLEWIPKVNRQRLFTHQWELPRGFLSHCGQDAEPRVMQAFYLDGAFSFVEMF